MAYNQKKSIIQGTSGHASALKQVKTSPKTHSGHPRNVNPYEGEKKRWVTEGKPSKKKNVIEKVKHFIKTKKKDVKEGIKDFFSK